MSSHRDCSPQDSVNTVAVAKGRLDVPSDFDMTSKPPTMDSASDAAEKDIEQLQISWLFRPSMTGSAATANTSQEKSDDAVASTSRGTEVRRQPLRRARIRRNRQMKKKFGFLSGSGTDSYLSSDSESQNADSVGVLDQEIDNRLEENASKNKLNAINVKNILREVLTNEEVVSMLRNSLQFPDTEADRQSPEPATYELRMTRSKVKKVLTEEKVPKPWPTSLEERPTFLDLEFPDDEEDDEYKPEEEPIDEEKETECEVSPLQIDEPTEEPTLEGNDIIATRTRSKLPMTGTRLEEIEEAFVAPDITADMYETECDDSEWQEFLTGLIKTDPVLTSVEAAEEDPNDPDFNYLAAPENEDDEEEDFKFEHFDRPFRVSKMEVNQLIDDLRVWFPDDDDEVVPLESKSPKKKTGPVEKGTPKVSSTSTPTKDIPQSPEVMEVETVPEQPDSGLPVLTEEQRETLKAQLQQHVQLTSQLFILSLSDRSFWESTAKMKKILIELDVLQRISPAKHLSVYRACPLKEAVDLTVALLDNDWVKQRPPAQAVKVRKGKGAYVSRHRLNKVQIDAILNSPVFLYGNMLPERGLSETDQRLEFRESEDMLIALALEQVQALDNKYELIHLYWMPCKDAIKIRKRMVNVGQDKCSSSPLAYFRKNAFAPPIECKMQPQQPVAPRYQALESLPECWRRHAKEKANANAEKKRKRSRSTSSSSLKVKPPETTPKVLSVPNSPEMVSDDSTPGPLDLASLIGLSLPELSRPEPKTPVKKTSERRTYIPIAPKPLDPSSLQTSAAQQKLLTRIPRRSTVKEARPSPKKTLIFPKNFTIDHKSISPTKRAALSVMKRAQHTYQRTSPCKIALPPRNWATYAKSLGRVIAPATATTTAATTTSASPSLPGRSPRGRPRKKKIVAQVQDGAENEQSDDMLEDTGKDEENGQNQGDDAFHLDQLMAASTTIQFDPRKGHSSNSASRPSRNRRRKDLKLALLAGDIVEADPKRDEIDKAFAKEYLNKVREALKTDTDLYMKLLQKMADFGQGLLTPLQLYECLKVFLKDFPDLLEDFTAFLNPAEAVECNCFGPNSDFMHARTFLRKLELCFEKQPTQFQRILKVFADWNGNRDKTPDELRDLLKPFLRHIPDIADDLTFFFSNEKPPEPLMSEFETLVLDDEALAAKDISEVEEIEFPDDADPYRTTRCPCRCHDDVNDKKYSARIKHCLKCSLKVIYGKVFFQFSQKRLVPACITYYDQLPEPDAPESYWEAVDCSQDTSALAIPGNASTPSSAADAGASASIGPRPLKRMKLKLTGAKAQSKTFVSLSEVLVSPSKDRDRGSQGSGDEVTERSRVRVITETIPQYPSLHSRLEMQPTALSEDTVSSSDHGGFTGMADLEAGAGGSLHSRQPATTERPKTSSVPTSGTRSGPRVILRIADGTSKVILNDSEWTDTAQTSNWKQPTTDSSSPEKRAMQSQSPNWINCSPSKSQDSSDLLSKALNQAQICKTDADFSMDEALLESYFNNLGMENHVTCSMGMEAATQTYINVTPAQGYSLVPSATTSAEGMEHSGSYFQEGQGIVKVEEDSQTPASPSCSDPVWTRHVDKLILETCKASGVGPEVFLALEKILPGHSAVQLERRLNHLLAVMTRTGEF